MKKAAGVKAFQLLKPTTLYTSKTLEEWYFLWDTHGLITDFCDMQLAGRLTQAKDSVNLTINLWIEDIKNGDGILTVDEVQSYCKDMPCWVWKSFANKVKKLNLPFSFQRINVNES